MSAHGGPNIVEDGLVLALDAANIKSFRGEPTTNIARNSRDFSGTAYASEDEWTSTEPTRLTKTYISSLVTPVGNGATLIQESGNTGYHHLSRYGGGEENGLHSLSCYIYPLGNDITDFCIGMLGDAANNIRFNLVTGEITYGGGISNRNAFITPVDNYPGWYRVGANIEGRAGGWVGCFGYSSYTSYTGTNESKKCYITGIQYEEKSYPTFFTEAQTTRGTTVATGGGWADRSGNGNNGELVNGPTYNSFNLGSINFDGVDDTITITNPPNNPTGSSPRSVSVWFYTEDSTWTDNVNNLFYYGSAATRQSFGIDFFTTYPNMEIWTFADDLTFSITGPKVGWHNVIATYDGNTNLKAYYNGIFSAEKTLGGVLNTGNTSINIGSSTTLSYFIGKVSNVSIYNRALSAAEVLQNYNATKGRYGL